MRRPICLVILLTVCCLGYANAEQTVNAIDQGWWNDSGLHFADNLNTITGRGAAIPPPEDFNSFFVFDLSAVSGVVTSAVLKLQQTTYQSVDSSEPFTVYDVTTPISELRATGFGRTDIFEDLQSGNEYGTGIATAGTVNAIHSIVLSSAAVADINDSLGGLFAVGVHLTSLVGPTDQAFHFANNLNEVSQLELVFLPEPVTVPIDIKPQSCPNPLNFKSRGILPVALLGTADFDVSDIDRASLRLAGVAPLRSDIEDVATPFPFPETEDCNDCTDLGEDGFDDLTLKFDTQEIVSALGPPCSCSEPPRVETGVPVEHGDCVLLELTGNLQDGTPIVGQDVVLILDQGK